MAEALIDSVSRLDLRFEPKPWRFADERRAEIDAFFAAARRDMPELWNGRVLLMHRYDIQGGVLSGGFFETDYASFYAWRRWECPDRTVWDCFASAAILTGDGAFMLGEMNTHTSNAGHIYFPCGTPDPNDIKGGRVDFDFSVAREVKEETGLDLGAFDLEPGWTVVRSGYHVSVVKVARTAERAAELKARVSASLATQSPPEFAAIHMAFAPADFTGAMPAHIRAFLAYRWGQSVRMAP
jgi:8-oxo-dGTP pyrophosphatase MutT (NUDIX family)